MAVAAALALGALVGCSSSGGGTAAPPSAEVTGSAAVQGGHLDPAGFAALVARPGSVLLDVRTAQEFAAGHVQGARNIDVESADFGQRLAGLDTNAAYAVYCRTGVRSEMAAQQMQAAGFTQVYDLAGGITAWAAAGRPVVTS